MRSVAALVLPSAGAILCAVAISCSASDDGKQFGNPSGGQGGSASTATEDPDLSVTTGTGTNQGCSDPNCIGTMPQGACDTSLAIDGADAMDGARAIGLCKVAEANTWGVVKAEWIRSDGMPLTGVLADGKGILDHFGNATKPREGAKMLALSSGSARNPTDPGFQDPGGYWKDDFPHGPPPGYPKESPSCPNVTTGAPFDSAGLRLVVKTPIDAKSFQFDFDFYTYEYPDWICTEFNDFFVALLTPKPMGLPDGNVSFDSQGNTISVNAGFLVSCNQSNAGGKNFQCPQGYGEILGTGFESNQAQLFPIQGSAATSWLQTAAPVENAGSEITLEFIVWDSGDGILDSTVLVDNFRFTLDETQTGTAPVPK